MGAAISGAKDPTARFGARLLQFGFILRFIAAIFLVFSLFGAVTVPSAHAAESRETAQPGHPADPARDALACDDRVACPPFFLLKTAAGFSLDRRAGLDAVIHRQRLPRYSSPQVDLPPPRTIA